MVKLQYFFENNTKLKTPIINTNQNIYITSEDVDGKPKENLTEIIYANRRNILSKDKFEIIAKCVQINSFFDLNEKIIFILLKQIMLFIFCGLRKSEYLDKKMSYLLDFRLI